MWPNKRPHEQLVIHKGWNRRGICDIWVLKGSRSWANIQYLYLEFWHCWGRRVLKSLVLIAWASEWLFSQLCTWLNLYPNRRKPFPVLLYNLLKQRSTSAPSVCRKGASLPDLGALFGWAGGRREGMGCHGPFGTEHWGRPACVALPAWPCLGGVSHPSFHYSHKIFSSKSPGLTQSKPWTVLSADFPVSHGQQTDNREKAAKGAFPVLCTAPQDAVDSVVSFPYFPK